MKLYVSGGSEGPINKLFEDTKEKLARDLIERIKKIFGDRFYLELNRHPSKLERNGFWCRKIYSWKRWLLQYPFGSH